VSIETEKALLEGLASHDKGAIETIYRENYSTIQAFIVKNNGFPDDARDIFQEAMIVLFEKAKSKSFVLSCQIKTYLYSVCRRLWLKKLQQQNKNYPSYELLEETVPVEDDLETYEKIDNDFKLMEHALMKLGEPCKGILEAYYVQRKSMPEIAEAFGYTNADNAKTQKYKCLMRLKKIFFAQYKNGG
jgi:RNA polymerase sigma factor (sigma-70 family)